MVIEAACDPLHNHICADAHIAALSLSVRRTCPMTLYRTCWMSFSDLSKPDFLRCLGLGSAEEDALAALAAASAFGCTGSLSVGSLLWLCSFLALHLQHQLRQLIYTTKPHSLRYCGAEEMSYATPAATSLLQRMLSSARDKRQAFCR